MLQNPNAPFSHGMEVEQFPNELPSEVRTNVMNNETGGITGWHDDASGPRETSIGPYKAPGRLLNRFLSGTRDEGVTWDWHSSNGSSGAGSHVHLCLAEDVFDDPVAGWTVAYNSVVELFPFFAPFFCHNWEDGFRDGTDYYRGGLNVQHWANGTTTRFSQDSVRERVQNPTRYQRDYEAVTFNPARDNGKPLTIELRANDAHPAMALEGLLLLRRLVGLCVERGVSPKLENHYATITACYEQIYERAAEVGLMTAMQEPIDGGITFQEGRGIPGTDQREFETMFELLETILKLRNETPGNWNRRAWSLVMAGRDDYSPSNNPESIWQTDADRGEFEWEQGPSAEETEGI